jgi:hypothetical protein
MCPLLAKACITHRCKFWIHETWTNTMTGEAKSEFECLFVWQYRLGRQQVVEQIRTQAVGDKISNGLAALTTVRALSGD